MSTYRGGRWSKQDEEKVKDYVNDGMSYEEISEITGRSVKNIKRKVEEELLMNLSEEVQIGRMAENDIKDGPEWTELCKQLSTNEQQTFLRHWGELIAQFKNDVTHTERLQIIDVIRNEIMINRVMERIYQAHSTIDDFRHDYTNERTKDTPDQNILIDLQRKIAESQLAIGALNRELKDLGDSKKGTLRDIKGTREQRIKRIEESKETITGWITALIAAPELRQKLGIYMEKFRVAQQIEYERLAEYHKYDDGGIEQPVLNSDTLKEDNY